MPLPGTRLIHPRFQAHHQPTVRGQMTATCEILRPSADWATVYTGPCRAQRTAPGSPLATVGDRATVGSAVTVAIPIAPNGPAVGDIVRLGECPDDPDLAGRQLGVVTSNQASIAWQRDLGCEVHAPVP